MLFDRVLGKPMTTQETELYTHEYDRPDYGKDEREWGLEPGDQIRRLDL